MPTDPPSAALVPAPVAPLGAVVEAARRYAEAAVSSATRTAYAADLAAFRAWCAGHGLSALPAAPETVALYLTALAGAGKKMATIDRALVAVSQAHRAAGYDSPRSSLAVRTVRRGIARTLGTAPKQKAPAVIAVVRRMVGALPADGLLAARDRALLLLGFAGGFRRAELVALDVADLAFSAEGAAVTLRWSKTDQEGAGRVVPVARGANPATCPVMAVGAWLSAAGILAGPVFRGVNRHGQLSPDRLTPGAVALIVKRAAVAAGLDPEKFAGHSLRAGLATTAARAGKSHAAIKAVTGHRSDRMVDRYIRRGQLFEDCANEGIGL